MLSGYTEQSTKEFLAAIGSNGGSTLIVIWIFELQFSAIKYMAHFTLQFNTGITISNTCIVGSKLFHILLVVRNKSEGLASFAGAARSANTVNVVGVAVRLVIVNDMTDIRDV